MATLLAEYASLKAAHLGLVAASVGLFAWRACAALRGAAWPRAAAARRASVAVDTALLASGVLLALAISVQPQRDDWFFAKLALLPLYVVCGALALRRRSGAWLLAALAAVAAMAAVALLKLPPWRWLG